MGEPRSPSVPAVPMAALDHLKMSLRETEDSEELTPQKLNMLAGSRFIRPIYDWFAVCPSICISDIN